MVLSMQGWWVSLRNVDSVHWWSTLRNMTRKTRLRGRISTARSRRCRICLISSDSMPTLLTLPAMRWLSTLMTSKSYVWYFSADIFHSISNIIWVCQRPVRSDGFFTVVCLLPAGRDIHLIVWFPVQRVRWYQTGKPFWILIKQEGVVLVSARPYANHCALFQ